MRLIRRLLRYATVSVISTSISLTILGALVATRTVTAGWANVIATAVGTVPSFELNRRWVWQKHGTRSLLAEVGPFWALSFAGLGLSTLAVSVAAGWAEGAHLGGTARTVAAEAANLATFGSLWVLQYVLLDRVLFRPAPVGEQAGGVELKAA
jgi:putative flippase GtrA